MAEVSLEWREFAEFSAAELYELLRFRQARMEKPAARRRMPLAARFVFGHAACRMGVESDSPRCERNNLLRLSEHPAA